jgi:CubicO group peptidase (beta-lactamase class C family)
MPSERLLHDTMAGYVEQGEVPGIVTLVSRGEDVHIDAIGVRSIESGEPMQRDTIFRIDSLTKPVTAAAAMILVDDGLLELGEPVDRLLPELAGRRVLKRIDGPLDDTVPANWPITVRDVLTFRLGFGIPMVPPDSYPIQQAVRELQLGSMGPPKPATPLEPDEWMRRFATLPLMHQPGERWMYNTGSYVLGVLIARAAGQSLESFLRERLFEPLGMTDTGFWVPPSKLSRLSSCYQPNPETGTLELHDGVVDSQWSVPPVFPDAAAGLVSTVDDYLAFGRIMLNGGIHGSDRILSESSVEAMTTDQITPEQKALSAFFPGFWDNRGWGFGVSIILEAGDLPAVPGRFGWDGGYGASWYAEPSNDLIGVLMSQRMFPAEPFFDDFWTSVYQATT